MIDSQVVVLYGVSLFVSAMESCLQGQPNLRVIRVNKSSAQAGQQINSLRPDAIIFDNGETALDDFPCVVQLLKDNPQALVIGLDVNSNELTLFSSEQRAATTAADVINTILTRAHSDHSVENVPK